MKPSPLRHPARLAGASLLRLQSDERLAELAVDGHEAAFDAIVDRYRSAIQRYCAGIVGPNRAEDATQQTLINAYDALKRTDEVRHLRSWLYRIAHNVSLNVLRSVRDDVPLDDVAAGEAGADAAEPLAAFERSERFRETVAALHALPERQRAALVLRELEGRSHEEIADALGVTKGSARQHLMRARVAMRSAVTALTPYPLIARLSDLMGGAGARVGTPGWADAAMGAGAGTALTKLTAGVVATGALVGGAVGTHEVVSHRGGDRGGAAVTRVAEKGAAAGAAISAPSSARTTPIAAAPGAAGTAPAAAGQAQGRPSSSPSPSSPSRRDRGRHRGTAKGRHGDHGKGHEHAPATAPAREHATGLGRTQRTAPHTSRGASQTAPGHTSGEATTAPPAVASPLGGGKQAATEVSDGRGQGPQTKPEAGSQRSTGEISLGDAIDAELGGKSSNSGKDQQ